MSQNISPATRAHSEVLAALTVHDEAIRTLKAQREALLDDEAAARTALSRGKSSPAILAAITDNLARAAALLPAIESLEAQRPALLRAVDRATAEVWAESVRALAPQGTYAARQVILDELADTIRAAVEEARERAEALADEAAVLVAEAARLDRIGALPRGASYSHTTGLTFGGTLIAAAPTSDLAEKVGRALDAEHAEVRRTAALLAHAQERAARDAENAAVAAETNAARAAAYMAPAGAR